MTTNFDTQIRYPTGIKATAEKDSHKIRILDDADLAAVSGGTVHDAVVRAALGVLFNDTYVEFQMGESYQRRMCEF